MSNKFKLYFYYDYIFPNFIIPNGLNKEMTIISYIYSQYNGEDPAEDSSTLFERNLEREDSLIKHLFGEHLGHWPTCLMHGGSHLKYECYQDLIDLTEDSVRLGRFRHNKYIYPIKISPHINDFLGMSTVGRKIVGEQFWKNISDRVLHDIRSGQAILFLDWAMENLLTHAQLLRLNDLIGEAGLPPENVIFAHNSFNSQQEFEKLIPVEFRRFTVKNWPFLMFHNSWHWNRHRQFIISEKQFLDSKQTLRENYFLFRIRRAREYRIALLYKLAEDSLLDLGDWSMLDAGLQDYSLYQMSETYFPTRPEILKKLHEKFPHSLRSEQDKNFNNISGWGDTSSAHSITSYFDITTETFMDGEYKSFTEKICKPLMNFQPFVLFAFKGSLKLLQELGFKTFNGFIDEKYDSESDHIIRTRMAYEEIKKLCHMPKQQLHDWYWSMEEILIHNHRTLLNFHKTDRYNLDLIKYLEKRINQ